MMLENTIKLQWQRNVHDDWNRNSSFNKWGGFTFWNSLPQETVGETSMNVFACALNVFLTKKCVISCKLEGHKLTQVGYWYHRWNTDFFPLLHEIIWQYLTVIVFSTPMIKPCCRWNMLGAWLEWEWAVCCHCNKSWLELSQDSPLFRWCTPGPWHLDDCRTSRRIQAGLWAGKGVGIG